MIRLALLCALMAGQATAQDVASAPAGELRVLDKITGSVTDLTLAKGETATVGHLSVTLDDCRYPVDNPSGNAFGALAVYYQNAPEPVFRGWMIAQAPAINAMEHPRYDVWVLRCITS